MTTTRSPRTATVADAAIVAGLLDRFNREFEVATPGPDVLAARLERLLAGGDVHLGQVQVGADHFVARHRVGGLY